MTWDFSTDPEFQAKLDWVRTFVRDKVEPLDVLFPGCEFLPLDEERRAVVDPLKQEVRDQGLWAAHLGPELGGQGFGAVKLTLLNEILGRTDWGSIVFGTQAPDTGNAEILARFGTQAQKDRFLAPLLAGEIFSCFSMTEPQGGADPRVFTTRAVRDGDEWVLTGRKYWSSNAAVASFLIVVAITDPDVPVHRGASTFLVPRDTPGVVIEDSHHVFGAHRHEPGHSLVRYQDVRVPADAMLGEEGHGFEVAQSRLAGGRLHHAMRAIGVGQKAIDMMAERAKSRFTQGSTLAEKQFVQGFVAESYTELMPFRLAVLHAAWLLDTQGEEAARRDIAALKVLTPKVMQSIVLRAVQVHGGLGITEQLPLMDMFMHGLALGLADGPTEAHKVNLARQLFRDYEADDPEWPTEFLGRRREAARARYGDMVGSVPSVPDRVPPFVPLPQP
ncbi:acyl-CoA dehydrogenase family protein [Trujillonella humicola]|uniref:acyl-CoA dehydrogenase family protein n=1 Tax=Trujillonella humicola TaxID=3383699 RepID=UPI0039061570